MRTHQYRGQPIKITDFSEDFEIARYEETLDGLKASGKYDGSFAYGSLIYNDEQPYIVGNIEEVTEDYVALRYWVPVIPETVGELTGLPDKNGKEIYEGDIVRYREYNQFINSTVYYHGGDVGYGCYIPFGNDMESCMGSDVIIIGNIHDNPELIK